MSLSAAYPLDDEDENSLPSLWATARYFLEMMANILFDPLSIAEMRIVGPKMRAEVLVWLRPIEALLRRLLYVDAVALLPSLPPSRKRARGKKVQRGAPRPFDLADPRSWGARLSLDPPFGLGVRRRCPPGRGRVYGALRLAMRWQACLNAIENPAAAARRLARRIRRRPASEGMFQFGGGPYAKAPDAARPGKARFGARAASMANAHALKSALTLIDTS